MCKLGFGVSVFSWALFPHLNSLHLQKSHEISWLSILSFTNLHPLALLLGTRAWSLWLIFVFSALLFGFNPGVGKIGGWGEGQGQRCFPSYPPVLAGRDKELTFVPLLQNHNSQFVHVEEQEPSYPPLNKQEQALGCSDTCWPVSPWSRHLTPLSLFFDLQNGNRNILHFLWLFRGSVNLLF